VRGPKLGEECLESGVLTAAHEKRLDLLHEADRFTLHAVAGVAKQRGDMALVHPDGIGGMALVPASRQRQPLAVGRINIASSVSPVIAQEESSCSARMPESPATNLDGRDLDLATAEHLCAKWLRLETRHEGEIAPESGVAMTRHKR
jgi:hypothetical protein